VAEDSPRGLADRILITLTGNIFPPAAALVMTPILARTLGVEGRGQLASVISPYLLLVTLASFGVPDAVTYFVASNPQTARIATRWASLIACFTGAAVVVAIVALRGWLSDGNADLAQLILIAAWAMVPAVCLGVVRGTMRMPETLWRGVSSAYSVPGFDAISRAGRQAAMNAPAVSQRQGADA
jgi:O-antigen/teichoic acid export membrane protein